MIWLGQRFVHSAQAYSLERGVVSHLGPGPMV